MVLPWHAPLLPQAAPLIYAQEPHTSLRNELPLLVADRRFPHLRRAASGDRRCPRVELAGTDGPDEGGAVLQPDHPLLAWTGHDRRADGGQGFDHATMNATMNDAVG